MEITPVLNGSISTQPGTDVLTDIYAGLSEVDPSCALTNAQINGPLEKLAVNHRSAETWWGKVC